MAIITFQSTPGFKAGRYPCLKIDVWVLCGFNPLPALRPGDTHFSSKYPWHLTFQSTPGFKAGRYPPATSSRAGGGCFNPLPALRPGDTGYPHFR